MHSGNFLKNQTGFGKETMRKMTKITKIIIIGLLLILALCGCTRREQLILEDNVVKREQQSADLQITEESGNPGQSGSQEECVWEQNSQQGRAEIADDKEPRTICVHVCGAVKNPDVYELPEGSRVYEAVQAAGGFTEDADSNYVNQAQRLADGIKLVIPTQEQTDAVGVEDEWQTPIGIVGEPEGESGQDAVSDGKININTATEAELCNIPGIGAVRAAAIIAYRQEKGGFSSIEDIKNVSGIKEGTYEKIKDSIKIN